VCGILAHKLTHKYLHGQSDRWDDVTSEQRELEAEATPFALLADFGVEQLAD
jgi:hypothetical protein